METSQIIEEFALNVKNAYGAEGDEYGLSAEWLEEFEESENVLNTCYQILNSPVDDYVKLYSVKVLQNKIQKSSHVVGLNGAKEIYNFLIEFIQRSPNLEITTQVCVVFVVIYNEIESWDISTTQIIQDLLSIIPEQSVSFGNTTDGLFSKKAATIFMREFYSYPGFSDSRKAINVNSKIILENQSIDQTISELIGEFKDDLFLNEIIEVNRLKASLFPIKSSHGFNNILTSCDILRQNDSENYKLTDVCVRCIKTCMDKFEINDDDAEKHYLFFSLFGKDLRRFIDAGIKSDDDYLSILITSLLAMFAKKFFRTYITYSNETHFWFLDELTYIGEFNNIKLYNEIIGFWIQFRNYFDLCDHPKFQSFTEIYCDALVVHSQKILLDFEPLMPQSLQGGNFNQWLRLDTEKCLSAVFKLIPIQPYFRDTVSIINSNPNDSSKVLPCLIFICSMKENKDFPVHFNEVMELIRNLPPNFLPSSMEIICRCLKDIVYYFLGLGKVSRRQKISLYSTYQWLARFPDAVTNSILYQRDWDRINGNDLLSDFKFVYNIMIFCSEVAQVESLAKFLNGLIIDIYMDDYDIEILSGLVEFILKALQQDWKNNPHKSDAARQAYFTMTAFAIFTDDLRGMLYESDDLPIMKKTIRLCFKLIDYFSDNEDICEKTLNVLGFVIVGSMYIYGNFKKLSAKFLRYYQNTSYSCFLLPLITFVEVFDHNDKCPRNWFLKHCKVLFEHSYNFIGHKDSNNHPRHIERLMKLLQSILSRQFQIVLDFIEIGNLVEMASKGILLKDESCFNECHNLLIELFTRPYTSFCINRSVTNSIVVRLYNSYVFQIVKNCIYVILLQTNISWVKACGHIMHIMHVVEETGVGNRLKIETWHICEMLETYTDNISRDKSLIENLTNILEFECVKLVPQANKKLKIWRFLLTLN